MIPSNLNRCRFEILENNKQTRESTALSVAYNVERWRRGWEGMGRRRRVATWTYLYMYTQTSTRGSSTLSPGTGHRIVWRPVAIPRASPRSPSVEGTRGRLLRVVQNSHHAQFVLSVCAFLESRSSA
jgi:hypothetical protein